MSALLVTYWGHASVEAEILHGTTGNVQTLTTPTNGDDAGLRAELAATAERHHALFYTELSGTHGRDVYLADSGQGHRWLAHGYPALSRYGAVTVHPLADYPEADSRALYYFSGDGQMQAEIVALLDAHGVTHRSFPAQRVQYFLSNPTFMG